MKVNPWDWIYATRDLCTVGWYEPDPVVSRRLLGDAIAIGARSVIDIGGGASSLVDHLLELDLDRVAVLDVSEAGLALAQARLGPRAADVAWIVGDVATVHDVGQFDVWHDRGAFHFLHDDDATQRYVALLERTVPPGGRAIIATFAVDGPDRCSGMPVRRYEPEHLAEICGPAFRLAESHRHLHHTPAGVGQQFQYSLLERIG